MASLARHTIDSGVVQDIVNELSLVDAREYQVQNVNGDGGNIRFFDGGAAAPDAGEGNEVPGLDSFSFTAASGTALWVWGVSGQAVIAINDDQ